MPGPCVVLVIDDTRGDSRMVETALEFVGFGGAVIAVDNAPQAFAYLARRPPYDTMPIPHIVMLDLNMPIIDGFSVLREMKSRPAWAKIPVLVFSSSRSPADVATALKLGADRFISKPVDWDGYVEVARQVQGVCTDAA